MNKKFTATSDHLSIAEQYATAIRELEATIDTLTTLSANTPNSDIQRSMTMVTTELHDAVNSLRAKANDRLVNDVINSASKAGKINV